MSSTQTDTYSLDKLCAHLSLIQRSALKFSCLGDADRKYYACALDREIVFMAKVFMVGRYEFGAARRKLLATHIARAHGRDSLRPLRPVP
jgi:hypothetical protein